MNNRQSLSSKSGSDEKRSGTVIYTIGHGSLQLSAFFRLLVINMIRIIVDVRSIPYSRKVPHFNKQNLMLMLPQAGIEYRFAGKHLGEFPGGRKPESGLKPDIAALYVRPAFRAGIKRVLELAKTAKLALMCCEENPYRCHRHFLITPALQDAGAHVVHLRHDGRNEPAALVRPPKPGRSRARLERKEKKHSSDSDDLFSRNRYHNMP